MAFATGKRPHRAGERMPTHRSRLAAFHSRARRSCPATPRRASRYPATLCQPVHEVPHATHLRHSPRPRLPRASDATLRCACPALRAPTPGGLLRGCVSRTRYVRSPLPPHAGRPAGRPARVLSPRRTLRRRRPVVGPRLPLRARPVLGSSRRPVPGGLARCAGCAHAHLPGRHLGRPRRRPSGDGRRLGRHLAYSPLGRRPHRGLPLQPGRARPAPAGLGSDPARRPPHCPGRARRAAARSRRAGPDRPPCRRRDGRHHPPGPCPRREPRPLRHHGYRGRQSAACE